MRENYIPILLLDIIQNYDIQINYNHYQSPRFILLCHTQQLYYQSKLLIVFRTHTFHTTHKLTPYIYTPYYPIPFPPNSKSLPYKYSGLFTYPLTNLPPLKHNSLPFSFLLPLRQLSTQICGKQQPEPSGVPPPP